MGLILETLFLLNRACIDTSERGELESGIHLGEYRLCHQWASLTEADQYNISVNVHNDGNILEIVGMCCEYFYFFSGCALSIFYFFNVEKHENGSVVKNLNGPWNRDYTIFLLGPLGLGFILYTLRPQ